MKAILIDATKQTITEIEVDADKKFSDQAHELLGCDCFTMAGIDENHSLICDDEGLLKNPEFFYTLKSYPAPLATSGVIVGVDEYGELKPATLTVEDLKNATTFLTRKEAKTLAKMLDSKVQRNIEESGDGVLY